MPQEEIGSAAAMAIKSKLLLSQEVSWEIESKTGSGLKEKEREHDKTASPSREEPCRARQM